MEFVTMEETFDMRDLIISWLGPAGGGLKSGGVGCRSLIHFGCISR